MCKKDIDFAPPHLFPLKITVGCEPLYIQFIYQSQTANQLCYCDK